jgi:DNA (cytosine-5)-methyltransferase 1
MKQSPPQKTAGAFYEFFCGGGMARAGLGPEWSCLFANDIDAKKAAAYTANWGNGVLKACDVALLETKDLPGHADLAWASFPCQDLSLAGSGAGLNGQRSGTFWPFWKLVESLADEQRIPGIVVLENVCGALTSHKGNDFATIALALSKAGYRYGALIVDAVHFVPQSRPRLFIIGVHESKLIPAELTNSAPDPLWHSRTLINAERGLSAIARKSWIWWRLPEASHRNTALADLIEETPQGVAWNTREETQRLLELMSPVNFAKVENARKLKRRMVGTIYKRTRSDRNGMKIQRAEIRFDDIAGCLRTPAGGSSRQTIMIVHGDTIRSRLLSPREAVRLMGLTDDYKLPEKYNDAYHLAGDGVAVPVVSYLAKNILEPVLASNRMPRKKAA